MEKICQKYLKIADMIEIKDGSFSHNFSLIPMAASIDKKTLNNLLETNTFRLPVIDHLFTLVSRIILKCGMS